MKKPITSDHFKHFQMPSRLKRMDDTLYFILKQANVEENCYDSDLYQYRDGTVTRLTASRKVNSYELVDGAVIFPALREKKDQEAAEKGTPLTVWYRLSPGMGEAMEWKRLPFTVRETAWIDGEHFFFTAAYSSQWEALVASQGGDLEKALEKKKENADYRVFEEIPFWTNGGGDISGVRSRLYYYSAGTICPLCDTTTNAGSLRLNPSKTMLAFTSESYEGKMPLSNQLMTLSVEAVERACADLKKAAGRTSPDARDSAGCTNAETDGALYELAVCHDLIPGAEYYSIDFRSDAEAILTVNRALSYGLNENAGFVRWNPETDETTLIYDGDPYSRGNSEGSDVKMGNGESDLVFNDEGFVMLSTVVNHAALVQVSRDGALTELTGPEAMVQEFIADPAGGYTAIAMTGSDGSELYHIGADGSFAALTSLNRHLSEEYEVIPPQEFSFVNENGLSITGYVIPPAGMEEGKRYPVILDIHGGPKTVYGPHFFHEMQYWANEGFAVIFTNPTGGDGRGNEFMDIRGKYGTVDFRDLMRFVDEALARFSFLDGERMGVTGGSYGGFMTNWIIGHTNRFKAAASQRSIASWLSFANTSDIGYYFNKDQTGATPWENPAQVWEHSPIRYADQVKTPTLFLHSDEDTRCWMVEGIQMFYALKTFGVPARLVLFHKETHELSRSGRPKSRIRRNEEILNWMKKWV